MATAVADHVTKSEETRPAPIVVDLGRKSRKKVKQLREGNGKLMDDVKGVLEELRASGTVKSDAQPVVIVVRERPRRNGLDMLFR